MFPVSKEMETDKVNNSNSESKPSWGAFVGLIFLFSILNRILQVWTADYIAIGISLFLVMLIAYRFRRVKANDALGKWILSALIYALGISIATFILSFVFKRYLDWG
jgi:hypothetical protein